MATRAGRWDADTQTEGAHAGPAAARSLLRLMREFDPHLPALVHDRQNGRAFLWSPKWAARYERGARPGGHGAVEFGGFVLDGWLEPREGKAS